MALRDALRWKGWYEDDPLARWRKFVQMAQDDEWYNSLDDERKKNVEQAAIYGDYQPIEGPAEKEGIEKYLGWALPSESPQEKFLGAHLPEAGRQALAAVEMPVRLPVNLAARASQAAFGGDPITDFLQKAVNLPIEYSRSLTEPWNYQRFEGGGGTVADFLANMAVWAPTLGAGLAGRLPAGAGAAVPGVAGLHWGTKALTPALMRAGMSPQAASKAASFAAMTGMPAIEQIAEGAPIEEAAKTIPHGLGMASAFAGLHALGMPYLGRVAGAGALGAGAAAIEGGGPLDIARGGVEFGLLEAGMNPYSARMEEARLLSKATKERGPINFESDEDAFRFLQQLEPEQRAEAAKFVRVAGKEVPEELQTALRAGLRGRPDEIISQYGALAQKYGPGLEPLGETGQNVLAWVEQARAAKEGRELTFEQARELSGAVRAQQEKGRQAVLDAAAQQKAAYEAEQRQGAEAVAATTRPSALPALPAVTETRKAEVTAQAKARDAKADARQRQLDDTAYAGSLYEMRRNEGMSDADILRDLHKQLGKKQGDAVFAWMKRAADTLGLGEAYRSPEEVQREFDFQRRTEEARAEGFEQAERERDLGKMTPEEQKAALAQEQRVRAEEETNRLWKATQEGRTVTQGLEDALTVGLRREKRVDERGNEYEAPVESRELTAQELADTLGRPRAEVDAVLRASGNRFEVRESPGGTRLYRVRGLENAGRDKNRERMPAPEGENRAGAYPRKRNRGQQQELPLLEPQEAEMPEGGRPLKAEPVSRAAAPAAPPEGSERNRVLAILRSGEGKGRPLKAETTRELTDAEHGALSQVVTPRTLQGLGVKTEVTEGGVTLRGSEKALQTVARLVERGGEMRAEVEGLEVTVPESVGATLKEGRRSLRGLTFEDVPGKGGKPGKTVVRGSASALDKAAAYLNSVPRTKKTTSGASALLSKVSGDLSRAAREARTPTAEQVAGAQALTRRGAPLGAPAERRPKDFRLPREEAPPTKAAEPVVGPKAEQAPEAPPPEAPKPVPETPAEKPAAPPVEPPKEGEKEPYWKTLVGQAKKKPPIEKFAAKGKKLTPEEKAARMEEAKKRAAAAEEEKKKAEDLKAAPAPQAKPEGKPSQAQVLLELRRRFPGGFTKARYEGGDLVLTAANGKEVRVRPVESIEIGKNDAAAVEKATGEALEGAEAPGSTSWLDGRVLLKLTERGTYDTTPVHEMLHIAQELGLISKAEWEVLKRRYTKDMTKQQVEDAAKEYANQYDIGMEMARELVYEEAIARGIEYSKSAYNVSAKEFWRERIQEMGNWLSEKGLRAKTRFVLGDEVVRTIRTGEILKRVSENPELMNEARPEMRREVNASISVRPIEKFSLRTLPSHEKAFVARAKELGIPEKEAAAWLRDAKAFGETLAVYKDLLPIPEEKASPVRKNRSYGDSMDFDALCPRTTAYYDLIYGVERKLGYHLSGEERVAITQSMRRLGLLAPCVQCYTETGRKQLANSRKEWAKELGIPEQAIDDPKFAQEWMGTNKLRISKFKDLMSRNAGISNKIKGYAEYSGQLLSLAKRNPELAEKYRTDGFLRWFSNSDFKAEHMADAMQAMADMAVERFKGICYTKQESFIKVFHKTGMKINVSVAGIWDKKTQTMRPDLAAGLDWDIARKWAKRSPNVGAAFVAKNPEQVDWAMKQDWIQNIILFHRSGYWDRDSMVAMHVPDAESYVNMTENTKEYAAIMEKYKNDPNFIKITSDNPRRDTEWTAVKADFDIAAADQVIKDWAAQKGSHMKITPKLVGEVIKDMKGLVGTAERAREAKEEAERVSAKRGRPIEKLAIKPEKEREVLLPTGREGVSRVRSGSTLYHGAVKTAAEKISEEGMLRAGEVARTGTRDERGLIWVWAMPEPAEQVSAKGFHEMDKGWEEGRAFRTVADRDLKLIDREAKLTAEEAAVMAEYNSRRQRYDPIEEGMTFWEATRKILQNDGLKDRFMPGLLKKMGYDGITYGSEGGKYPTQIGIAAETLPIEKLSVKGKGEGEGEDREPLKLGGKMKEIPLKEEDREKPRPDWKLLEGEGKGEKQERNDIAERLTELQEDVRDALARQDESVAKGLLTEVGALLKKRDEFNSRRGLKLVKYRLAGEAKPDERFPKRLEKIWNQVFPDADPDIIKMIHLAAIKPEKQVAYYRPKGEGPPARIEHAPTTASELAESFNYESPPKITDSDAEKLSWRIYKTTQDALVKDGFPEEVVLWRGGPVESGILSFTTAKSVARRFAGHVNNLAAYRVKRSDILTYAEALSPHYPGESEFHVDARKVEKVAEGQAAFDLEYAEGEGGKYGAKLPERTGTVEKKSIKQIGKKFVDEDVVPAVRAALGGTTRGVKEIVDIVSPTLRVDSKMLDRVHEALGRRYKTEFAIDSHIDEARKKMDKFTRDQQIEVFTQIERGQRHSDPVIREWQDYARKVLDDLWVEAKKRRKSAMGAIADYFPHRWKVLPNAKPGMQAAGMGVGRKPFEGSGRYFKRRVLSEIAQGIQAGGVPEHWNPADMFMSHVNDITKFITSYDMLEQFKSEGVAKLVRKGRNAPDGWRALDPKQSRMLAGPMPFAKIYMTPDAHRILSNYLSRDLIRESALGRGLMGLKNLTTQIELTASGFHATFEALELVGSQIGLGLRKMFNTKDFAGGVADILTAPTAPFKTFKLGKAIERYITDPQKFSQLPEMQWLRSRVPDVDLFVKDLFTSGARLRVDESYRTNWVKGFRQAIADGNYVGGLARAPMAAMEGMMKPLFEDLIPRWKVGLWAKEYAQALAERSSDLASGVVTREKLARDVWKFTEDRLGEMNFDNLFWNRTFKSGLQLAFRSITWKMGNLRGFGKVLPREAKALADYRRNRENPILDQNLAWLFGMSILTAAFGATAQKLLTGKDPGEDGEGINDVMKDLVFPRMDKNDDTQRLNTPTYWKDALHLIDSPAKYTRSSLSGIASKGLEVWANQDFYGTKISDETDNEAERVWAYFKHLFPIPISVQSFKRLDQEGYDKVKWSSLAGITKAPGYISLTDAQRLLREISGEKAARGGRTREEGEKAQQKWEAEVALKQGKQISKPSLLSDQEWNKLLKKRDEDPDLMRLKRLTVPELSRVWNEATDAERKKWRSTYLMKLENLYKTGPPAATVKKLREAYKAAAKYEEVEWN